MTRKEMAIQLRALRRSLEAPFRDAQRENDTQEMRRLEGIAGDIDDLLDEIALINLALLAQSLTAIKNRIDKLTEEAKAPDFGQATVAEINKAIELLFEQSSEEAPVPAGGLDLQDEADERDVVPIPGSAAKAEDPGLGTDGRLILTEAHLIALWKRSQFPVDGRGVIVFGLRGCRPVDVSGTDFADGHEITLQPVNYTTMNCTIGQWLPGKGLALFPGSTVPFRSTVEAKIAASGVGANQMGQGRYKRYQAGWHKRSGGPSGHWALLQECPITIQRTGDDADFDLLDRWEVGRIAGDNIHCAFHMGVDENIPDVRFSSAGCQTIAGTVKKGVRGSEVGPFRKFMEPFADRLGSQKSTEYVLFGAEEAQQMIRTRFAGKSVILRMGSQGALVKRLQDALNRRQGARVKVDGDFGPSTFQAVIDFQTQEFGRNADDGIVGPITAGRLGFEMPKFDFEDAIAGGSGLAGGAAPSTGSGRTDPGGPPPSDESLAWGAVTRKKHGEAFNQKVIDISQRLRCDPNHLMAVMAFETGGSFSTDVKNAAGSSATGLIQFMPSTAGGLGTTTEKLAKMTGVEQLDFVEAHFKSVAGRKALPTLSDVYMAVLLPSAIGKQDNHVLFRSPSKAYDQNKGLDVNKNGRITKAEATAKVHGKLVLGLKDSRIG